KKMIFSGKPISAEHAEDIGLVEQTVEGDNLMEEGLELARMIASNGPVALKQAKTAINHGTEMDIHNALILERQCYKETIPTYDRQEGLKERNQNIEAGGKEKYHQKNEEKGKLFVRKRLELLFDEQMDVEDAFFANCMDDSLPSDGVVTGIGVINGQQVCVMANDSTV